MKKNKRLKNVFFLLLVFCAVLSTSAQQTTVSGMVTSTTDGMSLPGVNVIIKGTQSGTSTDFDGNFSIDTEIGSVLVFTYIGYMAQEVTVGNSNTINVVLTEDVSALDEVVVVGYGAAKRSDLTGSVSSVKAEQLSAFPVLDAQQALQGRAAGVSVQSNNGGEPGAPINVTIRGNTSIGASSAPLVVVDGFVGGTYPQPQDIASVEVLKDASATAIYGSRGANGVIMVTTKKGKKGRMTVELNTNYTVQSVSNTIELLNADEFAAYQQQINSNYQQGPARTDWQDLIYQNGHTSNHQLSFSGGSDKINYYISGNYFDQKGIVVNSGFERFSFLSNVDADITDKLKVGFNAFGSRSTKDGVSTQANSGGRGSGDVISIAYRFAPDLGITDENGNYTFNSVGDDVDNPFAIATQTQDRTTTDRYRANFYGQYEIIEGLSFKTTFGWATRNEGRGRFQPSTLITTAGAQGGIGSYQTLKNSNILSENYLTYTTELGKGNFTALLGYSFQKDKTETAFAGAQGFVSNSVSYYDLGGGAVPLFPQSSLSEFELQSIYGRLNYDWDDKYLITLTGRRDGASNFAKNEKYAFFPSGALGWKVSNENFLKENNTINNLKLRYSYGVTGNPSIAPYQSLASYQPIYAVTGGETVNAVVPLQLANPDLKWESSYQSNLGVDLGLWKNRLSLSVDVYNINTKDLILGDSSVPEYTGFLRLEALKNIGEMNNKGVEIVLTSKNIANDNFSWTTDFNWSRNRNTIKTLVGEQDIFLNSAPGHFLLSETHILREGEPVGQFFGYEYKGVYQGGDLPAGTATFGGAESGAGNELFTDIDGDGAITTADRKIIGDPNKDWTAGFNNTLRYKNFDLNVFFQGAAGGDIYSYTLSELASGSSNATKEALNAWTPGNPSNVPSVAVREKRISSRFVYDGSYIRLRNLALGYNFPSTLVKKIGMQSARVSVSGQNLWTITDYPGTDPEVSYRSSGGQNSNVNQGFDYGNYPNVESVTFSLNLKF
ncbi:TonB-dependent receptor [Tamlana fucoidanivorans]|uniref:TonB-dependent receptor n=1 Tax=Allotamlana fucoidanivorans TaxID=2583814 RepID=A0A5C4SQV9_9FLAO|nr:TonB-dependent receptor [Tamlana fucoidanivorans]TNJ45836.1 TonB-dependent receptor [Tamlana fucoidanivorans]